MVSFLSRHSVITVGCLLALCGGTFVFVRTAMEWRRSSNKLRKLGTHIVPLTSEEQKQRIKSGLDVWWPNWGNTFTDGVCSNDRLPVNGVQAYVSKDKCCSAWFPGQNSLACLAHDGSRVTATTPGPPQTPPPTLTPVPTNCQDLPKYTNGKRANPTENWTMPDDSVWAGTSFSGMTCDGLKDVVPLDQPKAVKSFCDFLSQGIFSGPCAIEACCFCGGGDHMFVPRCRNMDWNSMNGTGAALNCDFIDSLPGNNQDRFCKQFGDTSFVEDGLTVNDACCACGGGERHYNHNFTSAGMRLQRGRNLQVEGVANAGTASATVSPNEISFDDTTSRDGLGESPGIPNLEYLGLGYDYYRGNPRGGLFTELDPGFRYRVLVLRQTQTELTVDHEYTVPLGTAIKYTSSCRYDSSSTDVSSSSDKRTSMAKEASLSRSASLSVSGTYGPFSASVEINYAFSESEKFKSETSLSKSERSVSFEAKAICSEYEASFIPGYGHELDPLFQKTLDDLPVPFNKNNTRHKAIWAKFFDTYGTNYVKSLILGGKRIHTTSMTTQTYSSLISDKVDVASTLSFDVSASLGYNADDKDESSKKSNANIVNNGDGSTGDITIVEGDGAPVVPPEDEKSGLFALEVEASVSLAKASSSSQQMEQSNKISKQTLTKREDTVGGLPSRDWREWAASVKARPMPIRYDLGDLTDFMSYEQAVAFIGATESIYAIELGTFDDSNPLDGTCYHGLFTGTGSPLSHLTVNPGNDQVYMQVDLLTDHVSTSNDDGGSISTAVKEQMVFEDGSLTGSWTSRDVAKAEYGACGVKIRYQKRFSYGCLGATTTEFAEDAIGIYDIGFKYCNTNIYSDQISYEDMANIPPDFVKDYVTDESPTGGNHVPASKEYNCPDNEFLCGFRIGYCGRENNGGVCKHLNGGCQTWTDDDQGIYALAAICKVRGEECLINSTISSPTQHCDDDEGSGCDQGSRQFQYEKLFDHDPAIMIGTDTIIVGASMKFDQDQTAALKKNEDHVGISGIKLRTRVTKYTPTGTSYNSFHYSDTWKTKIKQPTAHFATVIRKDIAPNVWARNNDDPFETIFNGITYQTINDTMFYTVTNDINSNGALAIMNFGDLDLNSTGASRLSSFSFLSVDTSVGDFGDSFRSGIVAHIGIILNEDGRDNFEVTMDHNKFTINFKNQSTYASEPTIVLHPNWFTINGAYYPEVLDDISYGIGQISTAGFEIMKIDNTSATGSARSYLGFNFLVVGDSMPTDNVKHGIITECADNRTYSHQNQTQTLHGITNVNCWPAEAINAAEIIFDTHFNDIPTVIITPYPADMGVAVAHKCILESITRSNVFVRCGLEFESELVSIPFTVVAVGY